MIEFGRHNRIEFPPGARMGGRIFSTFDLVFLHRGKMKLDVAGSSLTLTKRKAVLIFPGTRMDGICEAAAKVSSLHFSPAPDCALASFTWLRNRHNGFDLPENSLSVFVELEIERAVRLASVRQTPRVVEMRVAQLLLILSQWEIRPAAVYEGPLHAEAIAELASWMETNLDSRMTLREMAHRVGLSASQFRTVFKEQMGSSPAQFFLNIRMDAAKRMLLETNDAIKSIAMAVGFEDLSHFYRSFGQHAGKTPAEFRRAHAARRATATGRA